MAGMGTTRLQNRHASNDGENAMYKAWIDRQAAWYASGLPPASGGSSLPFTRRKSLEEGREVLSIAWP
jgi:hypothetical protein